MNCPYCDGIPTLVDGSAIYPHLPELHSKLFWKCDGCSAYVGCHAKGAPVRDSSGKVVPSDGTVPLGRLANAALRKAKQVAHSCFDPLWKMEYMSRAQAYAWAAAVLGIPAKDCHIGLFDVDQCFKLAELSNELMMAMKADQPKKAKKRKYT